MSDRWKEARERCEAAWGDFSSRLRIHWDDDFDEGELRADTPDHPNADWTYFNVLQTDHHKIAEWVFSARTDLPAALDEIERLQEEIARLQKIETAARNLLAGASGHYMNAEDRWILDSALGVQDEADARQALETPDDR
ncbi:MAG: hypothetical protein AAFQ22_13245 [Pseudomonadota bacterium]